MANRCSERLPGRAVPALAAALIAAGTAGAGWAAAAPASIDRRNRYDVEQERLHRVTGEIDRLRSRLTSFRAREGNLLDLLEQMDLEMALLQREVAELKERIERTGESLQQTRLEVDAARARVEQEKRELAAWLRELYTRGPVPYLALLVGVEDPDQLLTAYRYASFMTEAEAERLERYRAATVALEAAEGRLLDEEAALQDLRERREERAASLRQVRRRKRMELDRIRDEADLTEALVSDLARTESELRALLTRLQGEAGPSSARGPGIDRFRGLLDWPVDADILVPFGERLHPRFGTVTPHPGLALGSAPDRDIKAIFDGTVVFSDWFRGYGNMVILDHGGGYLSIYAHASRLLVEPGDEILQGEVIARTGDTGSLEGPKLYFEIRENGTPVNPLSWLQGR